MATYLSYPFRPQWQHISLALLDSSRRNWFCKSQLKSMVAIGLQNWRNCMVAIGLQKPYAKTKVGESCSCMMCILSADGCG
jgi:hypothetical protein